MRKPTTAFIFWDYRMQIKIRVLKYNELSEALKLIESTFMLFVAPDYMDQGVQSFFGVYK